MGNQQVQQNGKKRSISAHNNQQAGGDSTSRNKRSVQSGFGNHLDTVEDQQIFKRLENHKQNAGHSGTLSTNLLTDGPKVKSFTDSVTGILSQRKLPDISQEFLNECVKDKRKIDKVKVERLLNEKDMNYLHRTKFTKESAAHFCCKNGHVDVLNRILYNAPEVMSLQDDEGNFLIHSLCFNSVSKIEDLKQIILILKENCCVDLSAANANGKRPIEIIRQRIKDRNPYESNFAEIVKFEPYLREDSNLLNKLHAKQKQQSSKKGVNSYGDENQSSLSKQQRQNYGGGNY